MVHLRNTVLILLAATTLSAAAVEDCSAYYKQRAQDLYILDLRPVKSAKLTVKLQLIEDAVAKTEPGDILQLQGLVWRELPRLVAMLTVDLPGQVSLEHQRRPDSSDVSVTLKVLNKPGQPFHQPAPPDDNDINW